VGTPAPGAVKRLVDRFDLGREVFLSGDNEEKDQLSQAKMPQEPAALTACRPDASERQAVCHPDCEAARLNGSLR